MRLPFGLDLKSIIITILFMWFALPWIMGMIGRRGSSNSNGANA